MTARSTWFGVAGVLIALAVLSLLFFDGKEALVATSKVRPNLAWTEGIDWLDLIVLKQVSTFLLGAILLAAAGVALAFRHRVGRPLLYVALVQSLSTLIVDLAKTPFGRLRPYEAVVRNEWIDRWWLGAQSFPSGHSAFYAGLVLPIVAVWPRAWPLLAVPVYVAAARVADGDHYPSDVLASLALAALLTATLLPLARRHRAG